MSVRPVSIDLSSAAPRMQLVEPGTLFDRVTVLDFPTGAEFSLQLGSGQAFRIYAAGVLRLCPGEAGGLFAVITTAQPNVSVPLLIGLGTGYGG